MIHQGVKQHLEGPVATAKNQNPLPARLRRVTGPRGEIVWILCNASLNPPASEFGEFPQIGKDFFGAATLPRGLRKAGLLRLDRRAKEAPQVCYADGALPGCQFILAGSCGKLVPAGGIEPTA